MYDLTILITLGTWSKIESKFKLTIIKTLTYVKIEGHKGILYLEYEVQKYMCVFKYLLTFSSIYII